MFNKLAEIEKRYRELGEAMATPEVISDPDKLQKLARERAGIEDIVIKYQAYQERARALMETKGMLADELDEEMAGLVQQEIESLEAQQAELLEKIKMALVPRDANDDRDIIMEIRAGAGGDEAGLFAADLFRAYSRYAQTRGWTVDIIDSNESGIGGFKEIIFEVRGRGAFSRLKYERGVHRVQRVPVTESSGRIHTSTATVAVLPEADEVEVDINPDDLKMDFFHSGGAGGQNVNKVETAVRITHLPTGLVATCQDERSQLKNRLKAMSVLRARLLDLERNRQEQEVSQQRRSQVGTGDRSEKIRTYNFPQDRITDHRINLTIRNLSSFLDGNIDEIIDALATSERTRQLAEQLA